MDIDQKDYEARIAELEATLLKAAHQLEKMGDGGSAAHCRSSIYKQRLSRYEIAEIIRHLLSERME